MQQNNLFDLDRGERLKKDGMEKAEDNAKTALQLAREIAVEYALSHNRLCHADVVGRILKSRHGIDTLGPAAGSLFKTKNWEFTGQWIKSARITNHGRMIRVWYYNGTGNELE